MAGSGTGRGRERVAAGDGGRQFHFARHLGEQLYVNMKNCSRSSSDAKLGTQLIVLTSSTPVPSSERAAHPRTVSLRAVHHLLSTSAQSGTFGFAGRLKLALVLVVRDLGHTPDAHRLHAEVVEVIRELARGRHVEDACRHA